MGGRQHERPGPAIPSSNPQLVEITRPERPPEGGRGGTENAPGLCVTDSNSKALPMKLRSRPSGRHARRFGGYHDLCRACSWRQSRGVLP